MAKRSVSYDPGRPTPATKNPDGTWSVPSHRGDDAVYLVNLETRSCSCPSRQSPCKHLRSVSEQSVWLEAAAKAALLSDADLEKFLAKYNDDEHISGAIRFERARRKQDRQPAVTRDEQLKAVFA